MNYKIVEVKPGSTEARRIERLAERPMTTFPAAYKNPSQAKVDAYNDIADFAIEHNGHLGIVHANSFSFTALVDTPDAYYYFAKLCHRLPKVKTYANALRERNATHDLNKRRT